MHKSKKFYKLHLLINIINANLNKASIRSGYSIRYPDARIFFMTCWRRNKFKIKTFSKRSWLNTAGHCRSPERCFSWPLFLHSGDAVMGVGLPYGILAINYIETILNGITMYDTGIFNIDTRNLLVEADNEFNIYNQL